MCEPFAPLLFRRVGPFAAEPPSCRPLCDKTPLTAKAAAQRR